MWQRGFEVGDRVRWSGDNDAAVWLMVVETNELRGETRVHHWPAGTRVLPTAELELVERAHYAPPGIPMIPVQLDRLDQAAQTVRNAAKYGEIELREPSAVDREDWRTLAIDATLLVSAFLRDAQHAIDEERQSHG
jgi:hypothetical protein